MTQSFENEALTIYWIVWNPGYFCYSMLLWIHTHILINKNYLCSIHHWLIGLKSMLPTRFWHSISDLCDLKRLATGYLDYTNTCLWAWKFSGHIDIESRDKGAILQLWEWGAVRWGESLPCKSEPKCQANKNNNQKIIIKNNKNKQSKAL